jgi:hypothetical protein
MLLNFVLQSGTFEAQEFGGLGSAPPEHLKRTFDPEQTGRQEQLPVPS